MIVQDFIAIGVQPKNNGTQQKVRCPNCKAIGKENWKDECLSINLSDGLYNCHKCSWSGTVAKTQKEETVYQTPKRTNITKLNTQGLDFFVKRGITQEVIKTNKIHSTKQGDAVVFPYLENGKLVNYKTRFLDRKDFRQAKDAKPMMFNYDRISSAKEIIICEGEIDAMSFEVAGFEYHTSVNQGAPNENDKNIDGKLECIGNCYDAFEQAELIYIAVDNDPNGRRLQKELIKRFGFEKCKLIDFGDCKDANEYLQKHGADKLAELKATATDVKVEGIFDVSDVRESMLDSFRNGKRRGTTTYFPQIDEAWTHRSGEVTVWTGYENEGKSTLLNQLLLIKAVMEGDKTVFFTPENFPLDDFYDELSEMFLGKSVDSHYSNCATEDEYKEALDFCQGKFYAIYPKEDFKLDSIFDRTRYLVRRKGISHLVIDPYNTIEHLQRSNEREELYISRFMATLKRFAIENDISIHLVAHQNSAKVDLKTGNFYQPWSANIKGGAVFAQKADNVCFVQRPNIKTDRKDTSVLFGSLKVKKQRLVGIPQNIEGMVYLRNKARYFFNGFNPLNDASTDNMPNIPLGNPQIAFDSPDEAKKVFDDLGEDDDGLAF
ncbi:hypothetical protein AAU57_12085 [Nonlabens sp. YIK11]|uniref:DnaB-like helicase C-terminal domain-containing protein n=1 Tax=Nonlabens sp. YIK11 TaxID=1453349 RepID=UPI0006DC8D14|nr:DnaB-like helicase C-terminal domain-containing protein [Nonlabens sp. YIK11]KQC33987.1 hypothetical protein AAU57_12085 [Nonlabens sp. YIK11]